MIDAVRAWLLDIIEVSTTNTIGARVSTPMATSAACSAIQSSRLRRGPRAVPGAGPRGARASGDWETAVIRTPQV